MISKIEKEAIKILVADMRHARKVKGTLIRLTKEEPDRILQAIQTLPEEDQKYLKWLRIMAEEVSEVSYDNQNAT